MNEEPRSENVEEAEADLASERTVVVHEAATASEASVLRALLESAGITMLPRTVGDPFPMREPPAGFAGAEIAVLESQAEEARRILADYLARPENLPDEEST